MNLFFSIFEIIGTVAFAISGAMEAVRHKMDLFGVMMLGMITASGGGVLRDVIIGRIPPRAFLDPTCPLLALGVALAVFLLLRLHVKTAIVLPDRFREHLFLLSDTLGLAAFTVLGIESAGEGNAALLLFVGMITGVGGGVLRDVLAGTVPSIFRKHIYAVASAAGAAAHIALMNILSHQISMLAGFSVTVVIRLLAAHYKWNLPRIED